MRRLIHPPREEMHLESVLHALGDPIRLRIVRELSEGGEQRCGLLSEAAKSTSSRHFKILREAGVIRMRPAGTSYLNSLRLDDLEARFPGLLPTILKQNQGEAPQAPQAKDEEEL